MRHNDTRRNLVRTAFACLLVAGVIAPLAHSAQHGDQDGDCIMCLAHVGSPALVRDSVPFESPSSAHTWIEPVHATLLAAGHGAPFASRGPPVSQA